MQGITIEIHSNFNVSRYKVAKINHRHKTAVLEKENPLPWFGEKKPWIVPYPITEEGLKLPPGTSIKWV